MYQPDSLPPTQDAAVGLAHLRSGDRRILSGTTAELRSALGTQIARPGARSDLGVWRRVPTVTPDTTRVRFQAACSEVSAWDEADHLFHRDPALAGR